MQTYVAIIDTATALVVANGANIAGIVTLAAAALFVLALLTKRTTDPVLGPEVDYIRKGVLRTDDGVLFYDARFLNEQARRAGADTRNLGLVLRVAEETAGRAAA